MSFSASHAAHQAVVLAADGQGSERSAGCCQEVAVTDSAVGTPRILRGLCMQGEQSLGFAFSNCTAWQLTQMRCVTELPCDKVPLRCAASRPAGHGQPAASRKCRLGIKVSQAPASAIFYLLISFPSPGCIRPPCCRCPESELMPEIACTLIARRPASCSHKHCSSGWSRCHLPAAMICSEPQPCCL